MNEFKLDSAARLQEQLEWQRKIKRAVEIEEIREKPFIPNIAGIPYTPPASVWKPNTATLHAFAKNCIRSMLP